MNLTDIRAIGGDRTNIPKEKIKKLSRDVHEYTGKTSGMRTSWHLAAVSFTSFREQLAAGDAFGWPLESRDANTHTATDRPRTALTRTSD